MTPAGIEPATFRFVVQHFTHCATAVPHSKDKERENYHHHHVHEGLGVFPVP